MKHAQDRLYAIALAIQLRDNWRLYSEEELRQKVEQVVDTGVFSLRQVATMCGKSPSTVSRWVTRKSRTGGKLNPDDLEILRSIIFQRDMNDVDWGQISRVISRGTSLDFLAKITGISKSTLHRKMTNGHF